MGTLISAPWNYPPATGDAQEYSDVEWSEYWSALFAAGDDAVVTANKNRGVIDGKEGEFAVSGAASPVSVATGWAVVNGKLVKHSGAASTVAVPTPAAATRRDIIALQVDYATQLATLVRVAGAEGGALPSLTQSTAVWQIPLAEASIVITTGVITLTDMRAWVLQGQLLRNTNNSLQAGTGGNARGVYAVDLQETRTAVTEVASGENSVVAGGTSNTASGLISVTSGGYDNVASATGSVVSGGQANEATGPNSSIGGGTSNVASGEAATVPGGSENDAAGDYSFAAGRHAHTGANTGVFVWADSEHADFTADHANQFKVRASGGTYLLQNNNAAGFPVLELNQTDQDEAFVNFIGTSAGDATKNLSTMNTGAGAVNGPLSGANGWTFAGMIRAEVNGATVWIPAYTPV